VIYGLIWTKVFHVSSFEGYDCILVFFTFMPLGALIGGSLGATGLADLASAGRSGSKAPSKSGCARCNPRQVSSGSNRERLFVRVRRHV